MTYLSHYTSPLGAMTMASDGESLTGLWFDGQKYDRANINKVEVQEKNLPIFDLTKNWLDTYFTGAIPDFTPPLRLTGSDFRQRVLQQLMKIPYGQTWAYKQQAAAMGCPKAVRAVAAANGHNPISIIIPCHRVIGTNGSLTGYAGGIETKLWLLNLEQQLGHTIISSDKASDYLPPADRFESLPEESDDDNED